MSKQKSKYVNIDKPATIVCDGVELKLTYRVIIRITNENKTIELSANKLYMHGAEITFKLGNVDYMIDKALDDYDGDEYLTTIEVQSRYVSGWHSELIVR